MLILSRNPGQSIVIGEAVVITNMNKHRMDIGIDAPKEVSIRRSEVPPRLLPSEQEGIPVEQQD